MLPIITLTTDFGHESPYVAEMKAAILRIRRDVQLVDITHSIAPQDIRHGAVVLAAATPWFPAGSIHLAVVDPGVGTDRAILCCEIGDQLYVAPDNGLLSVLTRDRSCRRIIAVEQPKYWHQSVAATFHGRDIMAPVAAHLSCGVELPQLGTPRTHLVQLEWPAVAIDEGTVRGAVLWVDTFGNLITNIRRSDLPDEGPDASWRVTCRGRTCARWVDCYGQAEPGVLVALIGSDGYLELAVSKGSAARELDAQAGDPVMVARARHGG